MVAESRFILAHGAGDEKYSHRRPKFRRREGLLATAHDGHELLVRDSKKSSKLGVSFQAARLFQPCVIPAAALIVKLGKPCGALSSAIKPAGRLFRCKGPYR